jgi:predicted AAA+ superfamily ATPase
MKDIFKRLITDFNERKLPHIFKRDYDIPLDSKKIVSLIGVRRSGKSYILFYLIELLRKQIASDRIIYINFEDDRLLGLTLKDLDDLIEGYFEIYPDSRDKKIYIFLDEVQAVEGWELFARRIHDTLNASIFITGSSAKLLSREIATSLRGRTISYEIFPLSFSEYLRFKKIEVNLNSSKSLSYIKKNPDDYLFKGGFPEVVESDDSITKRILSDYADLIIYRDVIERYGITNNLLMKNLIKYCFSNIGTLLSINKLYNEYKSQGFKTGKDTLYEYFSYLNEAYALFGIPVFRNSVKEEQRNPKKIYSVDNGFKYIFDPFVSDDFSKLYENTVFLHLRRKTGKIYYFKGNQEVDFYWTSGRERGLVNVSYSINDKKTRGREMEGLVEAMDYTGSNRSILITKDIEETVRYGKKTIQIVPLYKWLIEDEF